MGRRLVPIAALAFALGLLATPAPTIVVAVDLCAPPSTEPDSRTVLEDSGYTDQSVLDNDACVPNGIDYVEAWDFFFVPCQCTLQNLSDHVRFRPIADWNGTTKYTYWVSDSGGTTGTGDEVTVTVTPVNDPPGFAITVNTTGATVAEDSGAYTSPGTISAYYPGGGPDEAGQTVTVGAVAANPALFAVQPYFDAQGHVRFTPAPNANGSTVVTYRAHDSGGTANGGIDTGAPWQDTITITAVADAPTGSADGYTVAPGSPLSVPAPGVLGNDTDLDGQGLTAALASSAAHGTVSLKPNGAFTYQAATGFSGLDTFSYTAGSQGLTSGPVTVSLTVTASNPNPAASNPNPTGSNPNPAASNPNPAASNPASPVTGVSASPAGSGASSPDAGASASASAGGSPGASASAAPSPAGSSGSGDVDLTPIVVAILVAGILVALGIVGAGFLSRRGGARGPTPGPPSPEPPGGT